MRTFLDQHKVRLKGLVPFTGRADNARRWKAFAKEYRNDAGRMLRHLPHFPDAILVAGCQRSGGTMLTRLLTACPGMGDIAYTSDRELAGALLLAGAGGEVVREGRQCFQTTYLNEHYREYLEQTTPFRLIWLIRNPYSVVRSMLYNWADYALQELYQGCGEQAAAAHAERNGLPSARRLSRLEKACFSYAAKNGQLLQLAGSDAVDFLVIDYDDLVEDSVTTLCRIGRFADLQFEPAQRHGISRGSLGKARDLTSRSLETITSLCMPSYEAARKLARRAPPAETR